MQSRQHFFFPVRQESEFIFLNDIITLGCQGVSRYEAEGVGCRRRSSHLIVLKNLPPLCNSLFLKWLAGKVSWREKNKAGKCKEPKKSWQTATIFLVLSPTEPPNPHWMPKVSAGRTFHLSTGQVYNSSHVQKGADNLTLSTLAVCFFKPWLTSAVQVSGKYLTFLANPSWSKEIRKREVRGQAMT